MSCNVKTVTVYSYLYKPQAGKTSMAKICNAITLVTVTVLLVNCFIKESESSSTKFACTDDQLSLTCSTNQTMSSIRWTVSKPESVNTIMVLITTATTDERLQELMYVRSSGVFQFNRSSSSPFTTELLIVNITADLNGTRVECTHHDNQNMARTTTTIIHVIQKNKAITNLKVTSIEYHRENVTVSLDWTQGENSVSNYNVTVVSNAINQMPVTYEAISTTEANITISYNTEYNVSVITQCQQASTTDNVINLNYVKCEYPLNLPSDVLILNDSFSDVATNGTIISVRCQDRNVQKEINSTNFNNYTHVSICSSNGKWDPDPTQIWCSAKCSHPPHAHHHNGLIRTSVDREPTLIGTNITFSCSDGLVLTGPSTAICTENGKWEPDPEEVDCKADCGLLPESDGVVNLVFNSTLEGSLLMYSCKDSVSITFTTSCSKNGMWSPIPTETCSTHIANRTAVIAATSSIAVFILSSLVFFIIGYLCGCRFGYKGHKPSDSGIVSAETLEGTVSLQQYQSQAAQPLYEDVIPNITSKDKLREFELEENIAYGTAK